MRKWLMLMITLLALVPYILACKESYGLNEEVIIEYIIETIGNGADCNISLYRNNTLLNNTEMLRHGLSYQLSIGILPQGGYMSNIECNLTNATFLGQCNFVVESSGDKMIFAAIILLPMLLGILFLIGAATLAKQHAPLRIVLFLLGPICFWTSAHLGMISVIEFYNFPEMQLLLAKTTYWTGWIFFIFLTYFLLYIFYQAVHTAAQKKKQRLEY